jgi:SAM-dependent methyltransferase
MAGFDDPALYGDRWAAVYDDIHGQMDPGPAVEFLAGLAGDGRVLELAVGTGRVALPLSARGITVEGVDASAAMVERLRAKPGGEEIPVTVGDMAQVPVSGRFRLVYLVFNTLFGLLSQARQAECFGSVGARARSGRDVRHRVLRPGPGPVRPRSAGPGAVGDRRLRDHRGVSPRQGAAARQYPDDHAGWPGDVPAAGGPPSWT